jgi:sporadic carbohydrate cluster protein (TIGR04323 family)
MDFRLAEGMYGDLLGRKIPAGYSHLIPETEEEEELLAQKPAKELAFNNGKNNIFYVANNTSATYPIPVHLQRYMLLDYSKKHGLTADLELFDLEDMLHLPTLWHIVEHRNVNVILYSIFALPEEEPERNRMLELALKKGMILHFVNEGLALNSAEDLETIKHYLEFSKYGNSRLPIGLPLSDFSRAYFNKWSASLAEWRNN